MLKKLILPLALAVSLMGCPQPTSPINTTDEAFCPAAQQNLLKLECKDSRGRLFGGPNKSNEDYSTICRRNIESNVPMYAECTAKITDCKELDPCFQH
jgi:hypothetical protein